MPTGVILPTRSLRIQGLKAIVPVPIKSQPPVTVEMFIAQAYAGSPGFTAAAHWRKSGRKDGNLSIPLYIESSASAGSGHPQAGAPICPGAYRVAEKLHHVRQAFAASLGISYK
jgi:hypothetical protein